MSHSQSNQLLALCFLAILVFTAKAPVLSTPYYWDELGWSRGVYWLSEMNLLRAIPGLHPPVTFSGRPPALHLTLASFFKMFGESIWLSHLFIVCFAILGVGSTYLLARYLYDAKTGFFSALFLFLSPMYFAQSGMFLADLPVSSLGVLTVYFALRERYVPYLLCASYLVFIKETSVPLIASLLIYFSLKTTPKPKKTSIQLLMYAIPLFEIAIYLAWQKLITGHSSARYDHYALINLEPRLVFYQAVVITKWLFFYQDRYIFSLLLGLNLIFNQQARQNKELMLFLLIFVFSSYSFAFLYPYFLPRYLLPALPYLYLTGTWSLMELIKATLWKTVAAVGILFFMLWSLATQSFSGNAEFNLGYLDVVKINKEMYDFIVSEFPDSRILTGWPHTIQLQHPHLGYVNKSLDVMALDGKGSSLRSLDAKHALQQVDLILISEGPGSSEMRELKTYALRNDWRLIRRFEKDPVIAELYERRN